MKLRSKRYWSLLCVAAVMTTLTTSVFATAGHGAERSVASDRPIASSGRTVGEATGTVNLAQLPRRAVEAPRPKKGEVWNLPRDPQSLLREQRASAAQKRATAAEGPARTSGPLAEPSTITTNFEGIDQQGAGCFPPDSDGAVGLTQYLQAVNCRVVVYSKSNNAQIASTNLAAFMGDPDFLFDPRALYDNTWNRFVVLASRQADSSTDTGRYYRINVSTTSSASGIYWQFRFDFGFSPGDWCDFPELGMTQDAILITCNLYHMNANGTNSFLNTYATSVAKARLYNGLGFTVPQFTLGGFTITPPLVAGQPMQQGNIAYLTTADSAADVVPVFRMVCPECGLGPPATTVTFQANVPVPGWDQPPLAFNGPGGPLLDTTAGGGGGMLQNTVQNGNFIWAVHTKRRVFNNTPFAVPEYYQIDVGTNTLVRSGVMFPESNSDAWRASVAVNPNNEVFFTYMSATASRFPDIRIDGCQVSAGDCSADLGVGTRIQLSTSFISNMDSLNRNRSGDYSSVDLDPSCPSGKQAFGTHEYVDATDNLWDSRIYRFGFGSTC